jgi:hypothetical protein
MRMIVHAHHAPAVSPRLLARAQEALDRIGARLPRTRDAVVRFATDGQRCRVEIALRAPRRGDVVALGSGKTFGPALSAALGRLATQVNRVQRVPDPRVRRERVARERARGPLSA